MATLDDILTVQKNGVAALNRVVQGQTPTYPFNAFNGGQGIAITATTSSSTHALVGASDNAPYTVVANQGTAWIYVQFGTSTVTATNASMAIPPGTRVPLTIGIVGASSFPTHVAVLAASGSVAVQITMGYGGGGS